MPKDQPNNGGTEPKWPKSFTEPPIRAARGIVAFVSHLAEGFVIGGGIKLFQLYLMLIGLETTLIWDVLPVKFLFDTLELGVISVFVVWGIIDFSNARQGQEEE